MCFACVSARQSVVVALRCTYVRRRAFSVVGIWLRQFLVEGKLVHSHPVQASWHVAVLVVQRCYHQMGQVLANQ
jgi:hypothetical protein